ncbi:hypothetical protein PUNSTDRAFT_51742 [Punctularia strigosozonata HHB-11173 SS5]|uniref:uncharacterized protein n=1 Tax=Punctularia strigosozonata (strain HHB-11173) TaxID=741275 RepID=UPI0004418357|nr:uncharacterized protein PUNSTDRAFT_51742 [Punctularia strigosozonata HHB-11173 SS5]EIN09467.1 hypothetical protein PUNSTDRAFT_51742 [Punctularia strigosozonata HHB-11173 SS5]
MLSPTPQHPPPPEPNVEPPSPPATPPPPPPKRFNLSFLPLLDPSSAASSSPPKPSPPKMQPSPSILSVIPPTPTFPHDTGSAPDLQEIGFASEEKASSSNYHLPTPDASPLRATSPLGTPDSAVGEDPLTLSALEGFPEPPQSVPRQHSGSYRSSCTPSPMPDTPQSATPSPDSHPNLHSYFLVRPNLPNHIPTNGAGIPDSPFVDPAHAPRSYFALNKAAPVAPDAQIRTQPPDVASRLQTQTQLKTFLRGIPSPTLNPPSPLALDPETVGASQGAAVPRQSSLRQSTTIRKKRRSVQLIEINGMLIPIGDDEDEDECDESESGQGQTTETPVAGPDQPRPASPSLVPLPASPPRVPVVPLA